ncbi:M16 family metallopeptidase, partial [uncultured Flavonifractor sp.]
MNYEKRTLPNGVRILTEEVPGVRSACLGIWVGTGSRHEAAGENGAAHFIEHMLFKGTATRTAAQLAEEMDAIGGQVNAFTTK